MFYIYGSFVSKYNGVSQNNNDLYNNKIWLLFLKLFRSRFKLGISQRKTRDTEKEAATKCGTYVTSVHLCQAQASLVQEVYVP